ncbi:MAG TPA: glycosyltransferase, partial [Flavisolibacter sp.]|nr:glycosyltransferase [Flavisolibacter sp.]
RSEAMNHGLPCIAFDCDTGPRHIISHNDDGLLVEKENPGKLAEAIGLLIENDRFRKQLGLRAKQNVARFYKASILEQWEKLFDRLLAE